MNDCVDDEISITGFVLMFVYVHSRISTAEANETVEVDFTNLIQIEGVAEFRAFPVREIPSTFSIWLNF